MTTRKKVSVLPVYLVGLAWLGYALFFPLNAPLHYLLCAALSLAVFTLGKAIFPDQESLPGSGEGEFSRQEQKAEDPQITALRRERDRAVSELRRQIGRAHV